MLGSRRSRPGATRAPPHTPAIAAPSPSPPPLTTVRVACRKVGRPQRQQQRGFSRSGVTGGASWRPWWRRPDPGRQDRVGGSGADEAALAAADGGRDGVGGSGREGGGDRTDVTLAAGIGWARQGAASPVLAALVGSDASQSRSGLSGVGCRIPSVGSCWQPASASMMVWQLGCGGRKGRDRRLCVGTASATGCGQRQWQ